MGSWLVKLVCFLAASALLGVSYALYWHWGKYSAFMHGIRAQSPDPLLFRSRTQPRMAVVLLVGDSRIARIPRDWNPGCPVDVYAFGVGGETIEGMARRMAQLRLKEDPVAIFVQLGINDAVGMSSIFGGQPALREVLAVYRNRYQAIVHSIHSRYPNALIGVLPVIPPSYPSGAYIFFNFERLVAFSKEANAAIESVASESLLIYDFGSVLSVRFDMADYSDALHLNRQGYTKYLSALTQDICYINAKRR